MKLRERKTKAPVAVRELSGVLRRLEEVQADLAQAVKADAEAQQALDEAKSITSDEFHGVIAPDEALRRRAAAEQTKLESGRRVEHLTELVQVGEDEALKLTDTIHEHDERERQAKIDADHEVIADANTAILGAQARLQRLADEGFEAERAHLDARAVINGRKRDWENEDRERVRKFIEGVRHQAAGVDELPARLRPAAERRLSELRGQGVSREYLQAVADRSGYTLLDPNGGPVRMPEV